MDDGDGCNDGDDDDVCDGDADDVDENGSSDGQGHKEPSVRNRNDKN